jgi:hypothetical protein
MGSCLNEALADRFLLLTSAFAFSGVQFQRHLSQGFVALRLLNQIISGAFASTLAGVNSNSWVALLGCMINSFIAACFYFGVTLHCSNLHAKPVSRQNIAEILMTDIQSIPVA